MTEPLCDNYLELCAERAESFDLNVVESRDMLSSLLAEVARLKAELAEAVRFRDAYKRAKAENDERYLCERDEARQECERLRHELDAATAALETQGQAAFVAGLRKPGLDALAIVNLADRIEKVVRHCYPFNSYGAELLPEADRAWDLYRNRPDSVGIEEAQALAVRTVVREMLGKAMGGDL